MKKINLAVVLSFVVVSSLAADVYAQRGGGFRGGRGAGGGPGMGRGRGMGHQMDEGAPLLMKILDSDHDGQLSPKEIADAAATLMQLDQNKDGTLTTTELMAAAEAGGHAGMAGDADTLHAMFDGRDKIKRTVKMLPDGAVSTTESDDEAIAALIQEHVPNMEHRVHENEPLPPMTFHPIFVELIKNADNYSLDYQDTAKGIKVTYQSDDPFVVRLVQEHAKLVSRFIKNGMQEIHTPYEFPADMKRLQSNRE